MRPGENQARAVPPDKVPAQSAQRLASPPGPPPSGSAPITTALSADPTRSSQQLVTSSGPHARACMAQRIRDAKWTAAPVTRSDGLNGRPWLTRGALGRAWAQRRRRAGNSADCGCDVLERGPVQQLMTSACAFAYSWAAVAQQPDSRAGTRHAGSICSRGHAATCAAGVSERSCSLLEQSRNNLASRGRREDGHSVFRCRVDRAASLS
jgi:hypothetical protein